MQSTADALRSILLFSRRSPNLQTTTITFPFRSPTTSIIIKHHYYFLLSSLFIWYKGITTSCNALTLRHYYSTPTTRYYHHHSPKFPKNPRRWNRFILLTSPPPPHRRHHQQFDDYDRLVVTSLVSPLTFIPMTRPRLLRSRRGTKNIMSTTTTTSLPAAEDDETTSTNDATNQTPEDVKSAPKKVKSSNKAVPKEVKSDDKENGGSSKTRKKRATSRTKTKKITTTTSSSGGGGTKRKSSRISSSNDDENDASSSEEQPTKKTKAPPSKKQAKKEPQRLTTKNPPTLPKLWDESQARNDDSYTFKVISWNVAGLRALLKNHPTALPHLVASHNNPDVICLQETKLQEIHVTDPKLKLAEVLDEEGYDCYYNCCREKKGYSGTAMFVKRREGGGGGKLPVMDGNDDATATKKKTTTKGQAKMNQFFKTTTTQKHPKDETQPPKATPSTPTSSSHHPITPHSLSYSLSPPHDAEGRIMTLTYPHFSLTNLYVPNSGAKLERLSYRTTSWDADLLAFSQKRTVPVILLGDLNVAHSSRDVWNDGAKHLATQAGTTPEERESFGKLLEEGGLVDAFRWLHPEAEGYYTYWSQRAGNRGPNKGLRLDYFVCSESLLKDGDGRVRVRDCYMMDDQMGSDHCPIVLEMEIKKKM